MAERARPPVTLTAEGRRALGLLAGLGLAAPAAAPETPGAQDTPDWVVHRWTAAALQDRTSPDGLIAAHRRAAAYWRWRVAVWPQSRADDVEQLLEARYHHHAAGDLNDALDANRGSLRPAADLGSMDHRTPAVGRSTQLGPAPLPPRRRHPHPAREPRPEPRRLRHRRTALPGLPDHHRGTRRPAGIATTYHQLGNLAYLRGDYDTAEQRYQASLAIKEELGNRAGLANSYGQLGNLAQDRGDYDTAEQRYQASLAITEELGDRATNAITYHHLGILAQFRGDYDTAEQRYQAALAIFEELGDRAGIASYLPPARECSPSDRGDYDTAEQRYQASLAIYEELGDRAGIANIYHQLGMLAQDRGDYDTAEQRYQAALAITRNSATGPASPTTTTSSGSSPRTAATTTPPNSATRPP